jgi:hypothetical protein
MAHSMDLIIDTESDNLALKASKMWILVAKDRHANNLRVFDNNDDSWKPHLRAASSISCHNLMGHDLPLLYKLFKFRPSKTTALKDTLLFSQILNYRRFGDKGHSLEAWGDHLGMPKQEHEDWSRYTPEMRSRCVTDTEINAKVDKILMEEYAILYHKNPLIRTHLKAEHAVAEWCAKARMHGWLFDRVAGEALLLKLSAESKAIKEELEPVLGVRFKNKDPKDDFKKPKWLKTGEYDSHTAKWFRVDPWSGAIGEERLVEGPYCRVELVELKLSSPADVKIFLFRNGWVPTEWNTKREANGKSVNTSPKITDESLEMLGGHGQLYRRYSTTNSRLAILTGWLEALDEKDYLHGEVFTIGTPSFRVRHKLIANIPSGEITDDGESVSLWGPEIRRLFTCPEGWKIIGADSAGNQARGLAFYLKNDEFTHELLNGDIHTFNAKALTNALLKMGIDHQVSRSIAKRVLYAFLFGASGKKLWSYIFGSFNAKQGNILKVEFTKAVPGFETLVNKLMSTYNYTKQFGEPYVPSISGAPVYVDSPHKLLVYLLQSLEKITCSLALMLLMEYLDTAKIEYVPLIMYHDEVQFMVKEADAEEAARLAKLAFKEGPKLVGVEIMDGDSKIGNNWQETH